MQTLPVNNRRALSYATGLLALAMSIPAFGANPPKANASSHQPSKSSKTKVAKGLTKAHEHMRADLENEKREAAERMEKIEHRSDEPAGAARFYMETRVSEGDVIDPQQRLEAAATQLAGRPVYSISKGQLLNRKNATTAVDTNTTGWTPLGPGNVGGRTRALLIHRTQTNLMWTAGVAGGIWKSTDGGKTFVPKGDQLANIAVNSMVQHPKLDNVIFAGTGEGFLNGDGQRGGGIYVSSDYGETWAPLASTIANTNFYYVNKLATSRGKKSNRLYAATRAGVFRSTDYGQTWQMVINAFTSTTPAGKQFYAGCFDLALQQQIEDVNGNPDNYVYASCGTIYGPELGAAYQNPAVLRAKDTDGDMTWEIVLQGSHQGRTSLAIAPSNENVIYALSAARNLAAPNNVYNDGLEGVYRSTDGGTNWERRTGYDSSSVLNTLLLSNPVYGVLDQCGFGGRQFLNQGWYDNIIAVDPKNPNIVWTGGVDLFRSTDGGQNFGIASHWWFDGYPGYAHADQHTIVFHPMYNGASNKVMFVGNDGGLFRTENARAAVTTDIRGVCGDDAGLPPDRVVWNDVNHGYAVTQFYHGAIFPDGQTYFGGTQDNGTPLGTDTTGANGWSKILAGDGGYVAVDSSNTQTLYAENYSKSLQRTDDGGHNWEPIYLNDTFESSGNFLFTHPFALDPYNPSRVWYGGAYPTRSNDRGAHFQLAGAVGQRISAWGFGATSDRVFIGTQNGSVWTTGAATTSTYPTPWVKSTPRVGPTSAPFVSSVTTDPNNHDIVYATYSTFNSTASGSGHLFKGVLDPATNVITWARVDVAGSGLVDLPAHSLAIDPDNSMNMYLATDLGLFVTRDGGTTWAQENTGFANVFTKWLEIKRVGAKKFLYAFTHGRSAWRIPLN